MNRRGFLAAILACGAAPYVMSGGVASGVLMPVHKVWVPPNSLDVEHHWYLPGWAGTVDPLEQRGLLVMTYTKKGVRFSEREAWAAFELPPEQITASKSCFLYYLHDQGII